MYNLPRNTLAACVAALLAASPAASRSLLINALGTTLDGTGHVQKFSALVIDDNGRILQRIAPDAPQPAPLPGDHVIDAGGRAVLPGLIDAHGHVESLSEQTLHAEMGQIVAGLKPGRETDRETIIFWHRGLSLSDIALAHAMIEKGERLGIGQKLRWA